jgi:hypothetical protein
MRNVGATDVDKVCKLIIVFRDRGNKQLHIIKTMFHKFSVNYKAS